MVCKRGNKYCQQIGCDCYRTARMEEIDAELQEAGINLCDLEKRTKTIVRLAKESIGLWELLKDGYDKVGAIVGDFSTEHSPYNYTPILNDNLILLRRWLDDVDAEINRAKGEVPA